MKNILLSRPGQIIAAIILFLLISFAYFPDQLEGKNLQQHDKTTWQGMSKEIKDFEEETGEKSLWTNSMFSGMPSYLINIPKSNNIFQKFHQALNLNFYRPISSIFVYLLCGFIALLLLGIKPWLAMAGAIAIGLSSYNLIIIEAGHLTKVIAMGYMPVVIAASIRVLKRDYLVGGVFFSVFMSMLILTNHLQIAYYSLLTVLIISIVYAIDAFKEKDYKHILVSASVLLVGVLLAIGTNFSTLITTYEYGKYSTRGESELTIVDENDKTTGLDKSYITGRWSYGRSETFTLLIPNFNGGSSVGELSKDSETYKVLKQNGVQGADKMIKNLYLYWGDQDSTSGPIYFGAIVIFLFVFALFIVKGKVRTWIVTATVLSILLSWGRHFMWFNSLFIDYFPGFNKFRVSSMILVIPQVIMPFYGMMAVNKLIKKEIEKKDLIHALKWSLSIVGGICVFWLLFAGAFFDFSSQLDARLVSSGWPQFLIDALKSDRETMLKKDALRSIVFIVLSAGAIWYFFKNKLKSNYFILILGLLILVDLWGVGKRYLNSDDFVTQREVQNTFAKSKADEIILEDPDPNYRVLNLSASTFNEATTSYFHKSIGGYHGAKMKKYQELIEYQIFGEMQQLIDLLNSRVMNPDSLFANKQVLNMLNTKYAIINRDYPPIQNTQRYGNAWCIQDIHWVATADEELLSLNTHDLSKEVVIRESHKEEVNDFKYDSLATIQLKVYEPNYLKYNFSAKTDQLVVFSEIYYPAGWIAKIDGQQVNYFSANYVLRAMNVPAGEHEIEFEFHPKSYYMGLNISMLSSIILLIALLAAIYVNRDKIGFKKKD